MEIVGADSKDDIMPVVDHVVAVAVRVSQKCIPVELSTRLCIYGTLIRLEQFI